MSKEKQKTGDLQKLTWSSFWETFQAKKHLDQWIWFMRKDYLKTFVLFIVGMLAVLFVTEKLAMVFNSDLFVKPVEPVNPAVDRMFPAFTIAILVLPLSLWLEDLGLRMMPWTFIHDIYKLDSIEVDLNWRGEWVIKDKRKWRVWLYHNSRVFYIVVSTMFNASIHQLVISEDLLGRCLYLMIHLTIGYMLAKIYIRRGFWQSYTIHISWNYMVIALGFLSIL